MHCRCSRGELEAERRVFGWKVVFCKVGHQRGLAFDNGIIHLVRSDFV